MKGFNMESIAKLGKMGLAAMNRNLPSILSGMAIAGLAAAVWTTFKATPDINSAVNGAKWEKADKLNESKEADETLSADDVTLNAWETFKAVAPYVWKPAACAAFSAGCVVAANVLNVQRLTMLAGAYKLSEKKLREYEDKAKELLGEKKATELHDEVVKGMTPDVPTDESAVIPTGKGTQLCYDSISGRYFYSSVEAIRTAESVLNKRLVSGDGVTLNELYFELGLEGIKLGNMFGWNVYAGDGYGQSGCVDIDLTFDAQEVNGEQKVVCILDYKPVLDDRNFCGRL